MLLPHAEQRGSPMSISIGIDLGGTKIAAAAVDLESGALLGRYVAPTEAHEGPPAVMERMAQVVDMVITQARLTRAQISALGVGVPGVIDPNSGTTVLLPNLATGWRGVTVVAEMRRLTNLATALVNDARAFTLAEATLGAGKGARTVVGVTLGTGIGGGIAVDGRIQLGINMTAGEIGHMTIDPFGPPCGCGNRGCLESFASGTAIAAQGAFAVIRGYTTSIGELVGRDINKITPATILQAAQQGDAVASEILERCGTYLGVGLANLVTVISPEKIVVGGGTAQLGEWILGPARREIEKRCFMTPLEHVAVVRAIIQDAGIVGAAVWADQQVRG
jgi:glucokinase